MKLAFYQGRSFVSRLIKWMTWGKYSHVAVILDDGRILEAWHKPNGVRWISHLGDGHQPGTLVEVFSVPPLPHPAAARVAAESLIGARYDFLGILGFIFRRRTHSRAKWFCSEAAAFVAVSGGVALIRGVRPFKISPSLLASSALLTPYGRAITGKSRTVVRRYPDDQFSPDSKPNPQVRGYPETANPSSAAVKARNEMAGVSAQTSVPDAGEQILQTAEGEMQAGLAAITAKRHGAIGTKEIGHNVSEIGAIVKPRPQTDSRPVPLSVDLSKAETVVDLRKADE